MKTYKISVNKSTIIVTDTPQRAIEMGFVFILSQLGHEHLILNIENGPLRWPEKKLHGFTIGKNAQDFIIKLLNRDRHKRLGSKVGMEVLNH
jgi:hypothetical protein